MSFILRDFVHELSTVEGDGSITLDGGVAGDDRVTFGSQMADGDTTFVTVKSTDNWEELSVQIVKGSPNNQLAVLAVIRNKAGNTTKIDWGAGTKDVFMTIPASLQVVSLSTGIIEPAYPLRMINPGHIELQGGGETFRVLVDSSGDLAILDKSDDSLVLGDEDDDGTRYLRTDRPFEAASLQAAAIVLGSDNVTTAATRELAAGASGTAQGGTANTITLESNASGVSGAYVGARIRLTSGTGSGQKRIGISYNASTKVLTVDRGWATQPVSGTGYAFESAPGESGRLVPLDSLGFVPYGMVRTMVGATDSADGEGGMLPWFLIEEQDHVLFGDGVKRAIQRRGSTETLSAGGWSFGSSNGPYTHGLTDKNGNSARPHGFEVVLECTGANIGYSSGWSVPLPTGSLTFGANVGVQPVNISDTQFRVLIGDDPLPLLRPDTRESGTISTNLWNIKVTPWRWSWL